MTERHHQSGFTLIELMVVVLIIGLVSSIAVPMLSRALEKASRTATGAQMLQLHDAMAQYYADNGNFPTLDPNTLEPLVSDGYLDNAGSILSKLKGGKPWLYLDLGSNGWWYIVNPKGDPDSRIYTGHVIIPSGLGSPINYDGVYWYHPTETNGLAHLDGEIGLGLAAESATRSYQLQDRLDLLSIQIDTLFESISGSNLLDTRRAITRELHFEPRAEELQTIARIASDETGDGPRHEFPRRFLAARILGDRTLKAVQDSRTLDAETLKDSADLLRELIDETRRLETDLEATLDSDDSLNHKDRDYLLKTGDALSLSRHTLLANAVLAYRLVELAEAAANDSLEAAEPGLAPQERAKIAGFAASNITEQSSRVVLDAAAIRTLTESLLGAWEALRPPSGDDTAARAARDALLQRMQDVHLAIEAVSERIQLQQDEALLARIDSLSDELRDAARGLFSIKLRLVPILRSPHDDLSEAASADLHKELAELAAEEQAAESGPHGATEDELYLGALKDMKTRKEKQDLEFTKSTRVSQAQRSRRRMAVMLILVGVLSIASAVVNFVILPGSNGEPKKPSVQELRPAANARRVETAGPLMITHVDGWNDLDAGERQAQVDKLGELVRDDGFQMMFVVNEYGDVAAAWDKQAGGGLVGPVVETPEDAPVAHAAGPPPAPARRPGMS